MIGRPDGGRVLGAPNETGTTGKAPGKVAGRHIICHKVAEENGSEDERGVDDITFAEGNKLWKRVKPRHGSGG